MSTVTSQAGLTVVWPTPHMSSRQAQVDESEQLCHACQDMRLLGLTNPSCRNRDYDEHSHSAASMGLPSMDCYASGALRQQAAPWKAVCPGAEV